MPASAAVTTKPSRRAPGAAGTWVALLLAALGCLAVWAVANQPVSPPDITRPVGGLAFSPFQRGQSPQDGNLPSAAEIRADLRIAAGISGQVRSYTVQGEMANLPAMASGLGLRLSIGAWLSADEAANAVEQARLIRAVRPGVNANHSIDRVIVGNEVLLRGDLTEAQLIAHIAAIRTATGLPVTTAEPWHVWLKHPALAHAVDVITIHLLPYWEGIPRTDALAFVQEKLDLVQAAYPGRKIVIGEIGWPSNGVEIGGARASRQDQAAFMRGFMQVASARGLDYFVMEAFDQPWKTSFEGRAAGYWGMFDLDRDAKWSLTGPVWETPEWPGWAAGSIVAAALLAGLLLRRRPDMAPTGKLLMAGLVQGFTACLACLLLAMSGRYLSAAAATVWVMLAGGQFLLLLLLLAGSFELTETVWGRVWRRTPVLARVPGSAQPKVSIHVACCNEPPQMLRRTLDALAALDYPDFEVLVVDNNTTDPALWEPVAEHCARLGARFRFFHLGAWKGFKAGALNFAAAHTAPDAEIIAVLDSDYEVNPDWLARTVPQFADPEVGFVQSPQDYRDGGESLFKRLMFWEYAGFFSVGMVTRNERDAIIQHGTMTLIRRAALDDAASIGGQHWAEWCICEDAELGLRLFRRGWRAVYSAESLGRGLMPDDFCAFRKQRFRWAYGAMQICRGHAGALLSPFNRELTLGQRWHFLTGWLPWVGDALGLGFLVLALVWSAGLVFDPVRFEFPVLLFMLPSLGLFVFRLAQGWMLYADRVRCGAADRAGAMLTGLALSHSIGVAVWKGLIVRSAPFLRTPKLKPAPALVQGLMMARSECLLLALSWSALAGVAVVHQLATWEARLWCVVLLTQSLPYLASVLVSVTAALPALSATTRPLPAQAEAWRTTAAGD
jgi:exo-beta-1,3-glucanase (GH17 family)/cellulose synthase/poly-beta-1,6-N-acetylglucosamine synthase-like glycosyltransferase